MITINKQAEGFTFSSYKERFYCQVNPLAETFDHKYTSETGKDKYDYTCYSGSSEVGCIIEVKVRDIESTTFPSILIEADKFDYLMSVHKKYGLTPFYQCFYNDGFVLLFNLLEFPDIKTEIERCPKHTATAEKQYIEKQVKKLPVDRGTFLTYTRPEDSTIKAKFFSSYSIA